MERDEFFKWLETCPTHKWEVTYDSTDYISVSFPVSDVEEEDE